MIYGASIACPKPLSPDFVKRIRKLEELLKAPVFLLCHDCGGRGADLGYQFVEGLLRVRRELPKQEIVVLVNSPGGDAQAAFQAASILRLVCGGYTAVIPCFAKSAATLFCLGARRLVLGPYAELGPLDVQHRESKRKGFQSALNEKQIIQRLHAASMECFDSLMSMIIGRLDLHSAEVETFIAPLLAHVADEFRPMFEKIDVIHWTSISRLLKIGEDYAIQLLQPMYKPKDATQIAHALVEAYPDHGFVINFIEAARIGLKVDLPGGELASVMDDLFDLVSEIEATGFITEKPK